MRCIESHQFKEAKKILSAFLENSPSYIHALVLYQDALLAEEGESEEKKAYSKQIALLDKTIQSYLLARQKTILSEKIQEMEGLLLQRPFFSAFLQLDLAKAFLLKKDYPKAQQHIQALLQEKSCIPQAHLLYAWYFLHTFQWSQALYHARKAKEYNPYLVKPYFFEAASEMVEGNYSDSLQCFKKIKILFPTYIWNTDEELGWQSAFWREISALKRARLWKKGLSLSQEALEFFPKQGLFLTDHAEFLLALGQKEEAIKYLETSLLYNPYQLNTVQVYRKILLEKDSYQKAFGLWERIIPQEILYHSENTLAPLYQNLKHAFQKARKEDIPSLVFLAEALEKIGWEKEARIIYEKIPGSEKEQKRLAQKIAFLEDMETLLSAYYDTGKLNIVQLITYINRIAKRNQIPLLTSPSQEFSSYFVLVREADPFNPRPGSLGEYLSNCNKALDLGNNYGHLDARLMNKISVRQHRIPEENLTYQAILGDETMIDTYLGYQSGSSKVAGRAFLSSKGFYVAIDTIRPSLGAIKYLYARLKSLLPEKSLEKDSYSSLADAFLIKAFSHIPIPDGEEKWDILFQLYLTRHIETVHKHELGHVKDFPCFLPLYSNLDNLFIMLWRNGFSPQKIHTRFESVAEIFGLTHSDYPHYYLSQLADRLDVNFSGLFELVYWAWYGTTPQKDPYYQTAQRIFQDISNISGNKPLSEILSLPETELHKILRKLYRKSKDMRVCE